MPRQQISAAVRVVTVHQRPQLVGADDAVEARVLRPGPAPHPGRLAGAHVVVLHSLRHRRDQILRPPKLRDRQHDGTARSLGATPKGWQVPADEDTGSSLQGACMAGVGLREWEASVRRGRVGSTARGDGVASAVSTREVPARCRARVPAPRVGSTLVPDSSDLGVGEVGELGADQRFQRPAGHPQDVAEVHHGQPRPAAGVAPLPGHRVRLGAADTRQPRGFLHRQQLRNVRHRDLT